MLTIDDGLNWAGIAAVDTKFAPDPANVITNVSASLNIRTLVLYGATVGANDSIIYVIGILLSANGPAKDIVVLNT